MIILTPPGTTRTCTCTWNHTDTTRYGYPEWTCIATPVLAVPLISLLFTPLFPHLYWIYGFVKALFGLHLGGAPPVSVSEFCKETHAWDGIGPFGKPATVEQMPSVERLSSVKPNVKGLAARYGDLL